jgi:hypothetical protein
MSEEIQKILSTIQGSLVAPKTQTNTFGKYRYRSCEDILKAVKPLLGEATLVINDKMVMLGDRFYVEATATITGDQESISATAFAREPETKKGMDEAQITGSTSSYARKYALNGLFAIDDTKDADATNKHGKDDKPPKKQTQPAVPFEEANVKEWITLATEASKKQDSDTFKMWWPANKADVIADTGPELAQKVHAEFVKLLDGLKK